MFSYYIGIKNAYKHFIISTCIFHSVLHYTQVFFGHCRLANMSGSGTQGAEGGEDNLLSHIKAGNFFLHNWYIPNFFPMGM